MKLNQIRSQRKVILGLALTAILVLFTGCIGDSNQSTQVSYDKPQPAQELAREQQEGEMNSTHSSQLNDTADRKLITEGDLQLETENLTEKNNKVEQAVENYSGYLANSQQRRASKQRQIYSYTIKVPANNFSELLTELENLGEIQQKQVSTKDVTDEYIDLETRKKNLTQQENRYRELLQEAEKVEAVLEIEKELNRVRTEIERIESRLERYNNQINLSTIQLRLSEPEPFFKPNRRLTDSLAQALQGFIDSIHLVIITTGRLIPWLILLILLGGLGYKGINHWRN